MDFKDNRQQNFKPYSYDNPRFKPTKDCSYGKNCWQLRDGTCTFKHTEEDKAYALAKPKKNPMRERGFNHN